MGIPGAVGQIASGTAAVADGLDTAGKCLDYESASAQQYGMWAAVTLV